MDITIELGQINDIDELECLYNSINDYLASGVNYSGWKKGVYPVRQDAINGVKNRNLFIAKLKGKIVGSVILNHEPDSAYEGVRWEFDSDYSDVFVVHTFVVHPSYLRCNIGKALLDFACQYGAESKMKSIRLDVYENNIPAVKLYEKCGFKYIDTVDLGLGEYGLDWFKVYEKLI